MKMTVKLTTTTKTYIETEPFFGNQTNHVNK